MTSPDLTTHERWRDRSAAEVLAEFDAAHRALVAALEHTGDEACAPGATAHQSIVEDDAGHYQAHFPVLHALLEWSPGMPS